MFAVPVETAPDEASFSRCGSVKFSVWPCSPLETGHLLAWRLRAHSKARQENAYGVGDIDTLIAVDVRRRRADEVAAAEEKIEDPNDV